MEPTPRTTTGPADRVDGAADAARPAGDGHRDGTAIRLEQVRKVFPGGSVAVEGLTLEVPEGELVALVGPSGCGKSTTLRMINRLIEPSGGHIWLGDEDVTKADPVRLRRRIGYVIQHVGLFPHQNVRANVATVPKLLGWNSRRVADRVDELLELVGLDSVTYGRRYPHELSGGQRQRVGVARALAADPAVLLMDEPFSAIDPIARARLQEEFRGLQQAVGKTVVMVTHDIDEAVRLADRIAVLSDHGRLEQYAAPADLLGKPANDFVAGFVGGDRALRRLAVTPINPVNVVPFSAVGAAAPAPDSDVGSVQVTASLKDAMVAVLTGDTGWVAVRDGDIWLGVLTADAIQAALRDHDGTEAAAP
ncbi:MAG TPA: ATP-binding cassette domain-containing protein [Cryptosporangiaceae bacterium]|nr:ATP-binding cassette domain-containing protein [Cryptosporangiaceae bacterium]